MIRTANLIQTFIGIGQQWVDFIDDVVLVIPICTLNVVQKPIQNISAHLIDHVNHVKYFAFVSMFFVVPLLLGFEFFFGNEIAHVFDAQFLVVLYGVDAKSRKFDGIQMIQRTTFGNDRTGLFPMFPTGFRGHGTFCHHQTTYISNKIHKIVNPLGSSSALIEDANVKNTN